MPCTSTHAHISHRLCPSQAPYAFPKHQASQQDAVSQRDQVDYCFSLQHVLNGTLCCIAGSQPSSPHLVGSLQAELCSHKSCLFTVTSGPGSAAETTHGNACYGLLTQVRRKRELPHSLQRAKYAGGLDALAIAQ